MSKLLTYLFILVGFISMVAFSIDSIGQSIFGEQVQVGVGTSTQQITRTGEDDQIYIVQSEGEE